MPDTTVVVCGNCTNTPEIKYSQGGTAVTSFGVAVTARRKTPSGDWENGETSFYEVSCFNQMAENTAESIAKGQRVIVYGRLKQSSWESDGQRRTKVEIIADEVGPSLKWGLSDGAVSTGGGKYSQGASKPANVVDEPF